MIFKACGGNSVPGRRNSMCQNPETPSASLRNSEKPSVAEDPWAGWNGGEMFREVLKEHGGGWSLFKHDKPLEDCKQRSKMIWFMKSHSGCCDCKKVTTCCQLSYKYLQYLSQNVHPWGLRVFLFKSLRAEWITEWICQWKVLVIHVLTAQGEESCAIPHSFQYFLIESIWTCYKPVDMLSTESPPKYLWKRNSSFYLVSNGRSEKHTFFFS